jgi:hypothetical protein
MGRITSTSSKTFHYVVYSEYYTNQLKNPTTVSIDKKPPQINLYNSARHSRSSQDRHQAPTMMPGLPGAGPVIPPMMGAPFFPGGFMNPWSAMMGHMGDMGHAALHTAGQAAGSSESAMGVNNGRSFHLTLAASHVLMFARPSS